MIRLLAAVGILTLSFHAYAAVSPSEPPVEVRGRIAKFTPPPPPLGFAWTLLDDLGAAVLVPVGWQQFRKSGPGARVVAFSPTALRADGTFETGLTVQMLWNPRGAEGGGVLPVAYTLIGEIESNKRDNTPLRRGTLEEKNGRKVAITRHRNSPPGLVPIVVHRMLIIDEKQSLVYALTFESPEATWDENWTLGEEMLRRVIIAFPEP
jgi:hypothetical protein